MKTAEPYEIVKCGDFQVSHCTTNFILHIILPNGQEYSIQSTSDGMMITKDDSNNPNIRAFQSPSDLTTIFVE
jgi:hypothetical protein